MKTMKLWRKSRLSECHANLFANGQTGAIYVIAFMMLAAFSLASCSSNDSEQDKPFTVCPEELVKFFACETSGETRGETATIDTLFTEDDIEWFNVSTREIRFKKQGEQLYMKLKKNYHKEGLEFRLGIVHHLALQDLASFPCVTPNYLSIIRKDITFEANK